MSCTLCESSISRTKPGVSCAGFCGQKSYHVSCVGISSDIAKNIKTNGLLWYCNTCFPAASDLNKHISTCLDEKLNAVIKNIEKIFTDAKQEICDLAKEQIKNVATKTPEKLSFAQVAAPQNVVVVKPKNISQKNIQTKSDIMNNVKLADINIKLHKVKNMREGGILVGLNNAEDTTKFRDAVKSKLAESYEVQEVKSKNPKIRIVGMIEKYEPAQLVEHLKYQNVILQSSKICLVEKIWPIKKNNNIFQAILEVDPETYVNVISLQNLFVNFDVCSVYDAVELRLCYKCSGFNHNHNKCSRNIACPRCSMPHQIKDCPEGSEPKCINCVNAKIVEFHHCAWDHSKCTVYKKKVEHYKNSLLGQ